MDGMQQFVSLSSIYCLCIDKRAGGVGGGVEQDEVGMSQICA